MAHLFNRSSGSRKLMSVGKIDYVQVDGVAVMRIIKNCHEDAMRMNIAQGALLGLIADNRMEITNCFPFLKTINDPKEEEKYQLTMMRRLRSINIDYLHVGWYQSTEVANFLTPELLESQYYYQATIEESVVLIYDVEQAKRGVVGLKAYRLTPEAMRLCEEGGYTSAAFRKKNVSYENLFVELPLVIRTSPLTNVLMAQLADYLPPDYGNDFLNLDISTVLVSTLRNVTKRVDVLYEDMTEYTRYLQASEKLTAEKNQELERHMLENASRIGRGETPLPKDDALKNFRQLEPPNCLNAIFNCAQLKGYAQDIDRFCAQSLGKLYLTRPLQEAKLAHEEEEREKLEKKKKKDKR